MVPLVSSRVGRSSAALLASTNQRTVLEQEVCYLHRGEPTLSSISIGILREESSTKMTDGAPAATPSSPSSSPPDYEKKLVILLYSSMSLHREQAGNYQRALTILQAKKIPYEGIDAADVQCRTRRDELFRISGQRGNYPQFFLFDRKAQSTTFLGDWDAIEALNDASGLPEEILDANPAIMTWDKVLGTSVASGYSNNNHIATRSF